MCKIQQSERVRKNSPVYLSIPVSLIRIKSTISPIFLLCSTNIHFKHVSLTAALNLSWKKTDFTYPSTSFSGATALVTFSVFIGLMESRGSCTMRPWTAGFSFTASILCRTLRKSVVSAFRLYMKGERTEI